MNKSKSSYPNGRSRSAFRLIREEEAIYNDRTLGKLVRKRTRPRLIDLFAGAGGMTLGFTKMSGHCFEPVWANDHSRYAVETYNSNFGPHCVLGDIVDILDDPKTKIPLADVVVGGPPCQGFSLLNKNRDSDPRKQLWRPFLEVVRRSNASIFVMENVPQLLNSFEHGEITGVAQEMGFHLTPAKLCAADYGVPQTRNRAFILGCRFTDPTIVFPPKKTHFNPKNGFQPKLNEEFGDYIKDAKPWRTVRDAIHNLPKPIGTEIRSQEEDPSLTLHFGRSPSPVSRMRYQVVFAEGMNRFDLERLAPHLTPGCWKRKKSGGTDLFGRLWWDRPAFTIRTEFFKPEKGRYLHPSQHRPITHREAARFQTFPDEFVFKGTKTETPLQTGNGG